jgi:hypothetical protein
MKKLTKEKMAKTKGGQNHFITDHQCSIYLERMMKTGMIEYGELYMKYC